MFHETILMDVQVVSLAAVGCSCWMGTNSNLSAQLSFLTEFVFLELFLLCDAVFVLFFLAMLQACYAKRCFFCCWHTACAVDEGVESLLSSLYILGALARCSGSKGRREEANHERD